MVFSRKISCIIAAVASWISHFFLIQHKFLLGKTTNCAYSDLSIWQKIFQKKKNKVRLSLQGKQQRAFAANNKILTFEWKLKLQKTFIGHCGLNSFLIIKGFFWWDHWWMLILTNVILWYHKFCNFWTSIFQMTNASCYKVMWGKIYSKYKMDKQVTI